MNEKKTPVDELNNSYKVLFDHMAEGAFCQSADGSVIEVNDAALAIFGMTRDSFVARREDSHPFSLYLEEGRKLPPEELPQTVALRTGKAVRNFVAAVYHQQSHSFSWLNISAVPLFLEGERTPYQAIVTLRDVSEQKRLNDIHLSRIHLMQFADNHTLEELLVEVLDELERLTGSVVGFYHFFDAETRMLTLMAWSTRTTGQFCQMESGGHYSIDDAGVWVDCVRLGEATIHNDYASLPNRRGLPKGHAPLIRELVVPVKRNGRVVAILGVGNKPAEYTEADLATVSLFADLTFDITERKKAKSLLLQAHHQLETLTNTAMDGYWVVDAEGRIVTANRTTCRMHGYSPEEMRTKSLQDLEAVESDEEIKAHLALIKERGYDRFESRVFTKSGAIMNTEVSAAYLPATGSFLAFIRDITQEKQMREDLLRSKEELKEANELLEQRVTRRTEALRAAIREQEAFSYSVSHDLRAPLRHINSFCNILKEEHGRELPPAALPYLERMVAASNRMGALIDHLLEMSRVARAEIRREEVNLTEIAEGTLCMLKETEPHRRVEEKIEPGMTVLGDQHLLTQLLENLLGNAWKYTSIKSTAHIEFGKIFLYGEESFFVKDNGAGFDMTYHDNLFKPFERLHGSEFDGVGIGLATAQRIIQRHGGKIWAEGAVGQGATFFFTLPLYW